MVSKIQKIIDKIYLYFSIFYQKLNFLTNFMLYNPKEVEEKTQERWDKEKLPEQIINRKNRKKFYLLDGPPYVNASPHVGHVKTTIYKDVWGKLKFMQGFKVWFQPGFDCGGLPIENKVEKKFGIKEKKDIKSIGVDKFIEECRKFAKGNENVWMDLYRKIGAWRGYLFPYLTSENYYRESGWWAIKKIYEKGLLVSGEKPNFWCPHCETVLSGYEVTDTYQELKTHSIFITFKVKGQDEYLLAWTTTSWTLPANVALCVHPDEKYVRIETKGRKIILAEKRLKLLDELNLKYSILDKFDGKKLEGLKYEPLLDIPLQKEIDKTEEAHRVILSIPLMKKRVASKIKVKKEIKGENEFGHLVDISTGTGIIHIAPGHGMEDNSIGEYYNLPNPSPVNEQGKLEEGTGIFECENTEKANKDILDYLESKNLLFYKTELLHSYPVCWRCKTPLIYRKSKQWFLKMDTLRPKILKEIKSVNWFPDFVEEQYSNLVQSSPDWPITRQRFWGIPLPIWICKKCKSIKIIGSREELKENAIEELSLDFDISVSVVDNIHLKCDCGGEMEREKDILDVWFDSGISPFASLGYPFKNEDLFKELWKVDLIDESQDQVRGWFNSLMVCGIALFGEAPYKTVCMNGWTLDEKGEKMSKSLGNVVWAKDAYEEIGADVLRLHLCSANAPWETLKFSMLETKIIQNNLNTLYNLVTFVNSYSKGAGDEKLNVKELPDIWLISKVNSLVKKVTEDLENFRFHYAIRKTIDFIVNDFSRIYIKLVRDRAESPEVRKIILYVLNKILKILAPVAPFISDELYNNLFEKSVHLESWPEPDKTKINSELEEKFEIAKEISKAANSERQKHSVRLKLPIKKATVFGSTKIKEVIDETKETIKSLSNLKEIEFKESENVEIKPNFAKIGKKFGAKTKEVAKLISKMKPEDLKDEIELGEFKIKRDDLVVRQRGAEGTIFSKGYVILDLTEDKGLKEERFLRELIREIQKARQEEKLNVLDKITLFLENKEFIKKFEDELKKEVRAEKIIYGLKEKKLEASYKDLNLGFGFERYVL